MTAAIRQQKQPQETFPTTFSISEYSAWCSSLATFSNLLHQRAETFRLLSMTTGGKAADHWASLSNNTEVLVKKQHDWKEAMKERRETIDWYREQTQRAQFSGWR
ncbi:MAG: hypothetical protein Q9209_001459 [Squamulea sp. 1 TL-2023]